MQCRHEGCCGSFKNQEYLGSEKWEVKCKNIKNIIFIHLSSLVIDSWGSFPSGVLYGTFYDLGNFDECLKVHQTISSSQTILGKYCFMGIPIEDVTEVEALKSMQIKIATCFPASCSSPQMELFAKQFYQNIFNTTNSNITLSIDESGCQTSESEPWDGLTIFTMYVPKNWFFNLNFDKKIRLKVIRSRIATVLAKILFSHWPMHTFSKFRSS